MNWKRLKYDIKLFMIRHDATLALAMMLTIGLLVGFSTVWITHK